MNSSPEGVCEKLFRAITLGPAFLTTHRIIAPQQQTTISHARAPPLQNPAKTQMASPQHPKPTTTEEAAAIPIKFDYTSAEKPKPIATSLNASTRLSPPGRMGQQVETRKPSTHNGEQPRNKFKPNWSPIQIRDEQHRTTKVEEAKKPTKNYKTFDEFIEQTKKKLFVDDEEQDLDKVVVEYGKNHHFST